MFGDNKKQQSDGKCFPGGGKKNLPPSAGDVRDTGSIPGSGRSPGGRHGNPLQYSCLENPMNRGVWWATVPSVPESEMSEAPACTHNFFSRKEKRKKILSYECIIPSVSSVTHLCPTLWDPMDCSTPGFPSPSPTPEVCSDSCPSSQ